MKNMNILIVGVGGQGTLLASRLLGNVAMNTGKDVKVSEVHGMSQRGGSVVTYVRYGQNLYSPLIEKGEADYILAFELLEALRYADYIKPDGKIIVNTQKIMPMPVIIGTEEYPQQILEKLRGICPDVLSLDALTLAQQSGSTKAVNTVLMGVLAKYLDFSMEEWLSAIDKVVPKRFTAMNKDAFKKGYEIEQE
jgi:indolepyruvate ferredoxin oxidoreductase beta subunit